MEIHLGNLEKYEGKYNTDKDHELGIVNENITGFKDNDKAELSDEQLKRLKGNIKQKNIGNKGLFWD